MPETGTARAYEKPEATMESGDSSSLQRPAETTSPLNAAADEGTAQHAPDPRLTESSGVSFVRMNWQLKAILPIAIVLLNGLLLFMLATVSWRDTERHTVLYVAGA